MVKSLTQQPSLFPNLTASFPSTRYQGSKAKLVDWIWEQICDLDFVTCLDAFGGTGSVAYRLKQEKKQVTYNDILRFNYYFGLGLIENSHIRLDSETINWLLQHHRFVNYDNIVQRNFHDIYFTDEENAWIDQTIANIYHLTNPYEFSLAFFGLCQSCMVKRPYNLFHRKNLYLRFADVERSFGNKTTWDRPFEDWFRIFVDEANQAIFDNDKRNKALNQNALSISEPYDLVYIDTPYISQTGSNVDYRSFYHFLEGMTIYNEWEAVIDFDSKHKRLIPQTSVWTDKRRIQSGFDKLFKHHRDSILVVSYRTDGVPSELELVELMKKYKRYVNVVHFGQYKYVLSNNSESKEMLIIGK